MDALRTENGIKAENDDNSVIICEGGGNEVSRKQCAIHDKLAVCDSGLLYESLLDIEELQQKFGLVSKAGSAIGECLHSPCSTLSQKQSQLSSGFFEDKDNLSSLASSFSSLCTYEKDLAAFTVNENCACVCKSDNDSSGSAFDFVVKASNCPSSHRDNSSMPQNQKNLLKSVNISGILPRSIFHWRSKCGQGDSTYPPPSPNTTTSHTSRSFKSESSLKIFLKNHINTLNIMNKLPGGDKVLKTQQNQNNKLVLSKSNSKQDKLSTTGLILETRPQGLPPKSMKEENKHKVQYNLIIQAIKKKEIVERQINDKKLEDKLKQEEYLSNCVKVWNNEIIPSWESVKQHPKVLGLWWYGLPSSVRGKVWKLAVGNALNVSEVSYATYLLKSRRNQVPADCDTSFKSMTSAFYPSSEEDCADIEKFAQLILLDVSRTFPTLCIFQRGGPYHELLYNLLCAYVSFQPSIGYVQGMSFLAAIILLNLEPHDAFMVFANLLSLPCFSTFFLVMRSKMALYFTTFSLFLQLNEPDLTLHFQEMNLTPDLYLTDWIYTLFSRSLPLDVVCRIWDLFFRDGEVFIFRASIGILRLHKEVLIKMDFSQLAEFLTKLPDSISEDVLFDSIESVSMFTPDNKSFSDIIHDLQDVHVKTLKPNHTPQDHESEYNANLTEQ